ncbi:hypothetical protein ACLOJK_015565 [Asimina triloba]
MTYESPLILRNQQPALTKFKYFKKRKLTGITQLIRLVANKPFFDRTQNQPARIRSGLPESPSSQHFLVKDQNSSSEVHFQTSKAHLRLPPNLENSTNSKNLRNESPGQRSQQHQNHRKSNHQKLDRIKTLPRAEIF